MQLHALRYVNNDFKTLKINRIKKQEFYFLQNLGGLPAILTANQAINSNRKPLTVNCQLLTV